MAKLCEEIRKKKLPLTKDMRVKEDKCNSRDSGFSLLSENASFFNLFSLFLVLIFAYHMVYVNEFHIESLFT